jgi:hypothetical protein
LKVERDPVVYEAVRIMMEDSKDRRKNHHIADDYDDFDGMYYNNLDHDDDEFEDDPYDDY